MALLSYHIISNPEVLSKLRKELEPVFPDPAVLPSCSKLSFSNVMFFPRLLLVSGGKRGHVNRLETPESSADLRLLTSV